MEKNKIKELENKIQELNNYLEKINALMWNHFCIKPEYRRMTDEVCWRYAMDILEEWAEKN